MARHFLDGWTLTQLRDAYNTAAHSLDRPTVSRFSDKEAAQRRVEAMLIDAGLAAALVDGRVVVSAPEKKAREGDDLLIIIKSANPKRPGSRAHDLYARLRNRMTVGAWVKLVGSRRLAMIDLRYNIEHGHVELSAV